MSLAGAPVIGTIIRDEGLAKGHILAQASNRTAEDYRQLRRTCSSSTSISPTK
jgi:hypothetical protein